MRAAEKPELLERLRDQRIPLEMCPSSNVQTKAVPSLSRHPILEFLRQGLCVTVNTDNMTVSDTTIEKEFGLLSRELGMTAEERKKLLLNAADAAFSDVGGAVAAERRNRKDMLLNLWSLK